MANEVSIIIKALDQATSTIKGIGNSLNTLAKDNEATFTSLATVGGATFGALTLAVGTSVKAFQESEIAGKRLETIARQVTGATDEQISSFKDLATQLQKVGVVEDDAIIAGQSQIASFTKNSGVVTELTNDLADLAVAQYGTNVSQDQMIQTGNLLGKALQGNLGALTRTGILVSEDFTKAFESANTEQERAVILSQIIQDNYGGLNESMRATSEGGLQALKNSFGDLQENLGSAFVPILDRLAQSLLPLIDKFSQRASENPTLVTTIVAIVGAFSGLLVVVGGLGLILPAITGGFMALISPVGLVVLAIAGLIAIGVALYMHRDEIKAYAIEVWNSIKEYFNQLWIDIKQVFTDAIGFLTEIWNAVWNSYVTIFNTIWNILKGAVTAGFNWLKSLFTSIVAPLSQAWNVVWTSIGNTVVSAWEGIKTTIKNGINWVLEKINFVIEMANKVASMGAGIGISVPKIPKIPMLAEGGIVTRPTLAMIGEGGESEAVIPLSKLEKMMGGGPGITINMGGVTVSNEADENRLAQKISEQITRQMQLYQYGIS